MQASRQPAAAAASNLTCACHGAPPRRTGLQRLNARRAAVSIRRQRAIEHRCEFIEFLRRRTGVIRLPERILAQRSVPRKSVETGACLAVRPPLPGSRDWMHTDGRRTARVFAGRRARRRIPMTNPWNECGVSRRDVLRLGAGGLGLGLAGGLGPVPTVLAQASRRAAANPTGKILVVFEWLGGNDGLDTGRAVWRAR